MNDASSSSCRSGMTLIEILVVMAIIAILLALIFPAVGIARTEVARGEARQTISELGIAFERYRQEDERKRYPAVRIDRGIHADLLEILDERRLWSRGRRELGPMGLLLDPWRQPYCYALTRPGPRDGAEALLAWNWDATAGRESRWGPRRDPVSGATAEGPLPFPYLWSLGPKGADDDASSWIIVEDGR